MDVNSDKMLQTALASGRVIDKDTTILTIAHRLGTISDSDMVLVLGQGQVLEFAPPPSRTDPTGPPTLFATMLAEQQSKQP